MHNELPSDHAAFLRRAMDVLRADARFVGLAVGGSYLDGTMDEWSDLDLVIAVEPDEFEQVMLDRREIASRMGTVLTSFTGEHVREPRLLICLYEDPLLHVDLKFVRLPDLSSRVEDPAVLWERDGRMSDALRVGTARFPQPRPAWIDERIWVWVHYVAAKVGRGELFEACASLSFLREQVLGPMALAVEGKRPSGVRKIEQYVPDVVPRMRETLGTYDAAGCTAALRAAVALYRELRPQLAPLPAGPGAGEEAALAYLARVEAAHRRTP